MVVGAVRGMGSAVKTVQRGRRSVRCEDHIPNRVGTISLIQFLACCAPKCRWSGSPGSGVDVVAVVSRYATPGVKQEMVAVTPCGGRVSHLAPIGREHFEDAVLADEIVAAFVGLRAAHTLGKDSELHSNSVPPVGFLRSDPRILWFGSPSARFAMGA